jgi:GTP pyrophosphokinase
MLNSKYLLNDLYKLLEQYLEQEQIKIVSNAYQMANKAHTGQFRKSGEAYISHPISVAIILAELKLDEHTITAALLHDCIEDTSISKNDVAQEFGSDVAHLVDGVSKLTDFKFTSVEEQQAKNFQKLLMAMSQDIRVVLIKIADRMHNIRTLNVMSRDKQIRIAKETLDIYAPITQRLGLYKLSSELEDLSFKILMPLRYKVLKKNIKRKTGDYQKTIKKINDELIKRMVQDNLTASVKGRVKKVYSVYLKMKQQKLKFNDIFDIFAFRIITNNLAECYQVLGSIHNLYKPMPGKFKDYIALAKTNGYQSLHTIVFVEKILIEVQIRTQAMDRVAEEGIAAHFKYKLHENSDIIAKPLMSSLLEVDKQNNSHREFLEEIKKGLFPNDVFVFTPKGDILQLPYHATALDFAYEIHTNVGNFCSKIKINNYFSPLDTKLISGQIVEVITQDELRVKPKWLNFVQTSKAKSAIKLALKNMTKEKLEESGKILLEKSLENKKLKFTITKILKTFNCLNNKELFIKIGSGEVPLNLVLEALLDNHRHLSIKGNEDLSINFSHCCYPILNDKILGVMTKNKGLTVHRYRCKTFKSYLHNHKQYAIKLDWHDKCELMFKVAIRCEVENRRGILAKITNIIADLDVDIDKLSIAEEQSQLRYLDFILSVTDRNQLAKIIRKIKSNKLVHFVYRNG